MYPRLMIDLSKIKNNVRVMRELTDRGKVQLGIVTKSFTADRKTVEAVVEQGVDLLADARIKNIKGYADLGVPTLLLRIPQPCEIEEVIRYADISLNSELSTIRKMDEEAKKQNKIHKVVIMIDLGDLREGIFYENEEEILKTAEAIHQLQNIELYGVGVNLTCYGAVIPKNDNLSILVELARKIENKLGIKLQMISGGNSSSIYLIDKGELPEGINSLRIGEAFILGNETAYGAKVEGTVDDAVILQAQLVEVKHKPTLPIGEIGKDAFGQVPYYEDKGIAKRGILALGKQDTDPDSMTPLDPKVEIMGGSSDHTIVDLTHSDKDYQVGDIVEFKLGYGALLKLFTSSYVDRAYR
ncbi:MAG: ornithine racemase Orr [Peptostreptococcaceae bacterium]|nr:ornithine racemase Orr [Peptostreptococcaceae bacterium]